MYSASGNHDVMDFAYAILAHGCDQVFIHSFRTTLSRLRWLMCLRVGVQNLSLVGLHRVVFFSPKHRFPRPVQIDALYCRLIGVSKLHVLCVCALLDNIAQKAGPHSLSIHYQSAFQDTFIKSQLCLRNTLLS